MNEESERIIELRDRLHNSLEELDSLVQSCLGAAPDIVYAELTNPRRLLMNSRQLNNPRQSW